MSLIEKIDKRIKYYQEFYADRYHAKAEGLEVAKQIILSEQKEPCEYCASGYVYYLQKDAKFCPMCGRPLNKEANTNA